MGLSHSPLLPTNGLVMCIDPRNKKSYGGSGTTVTDLVGNYNGTLTNGPTFDSNKKALVFDGTNDWLDSGFGNDNSFFLAAAGSAFSVVICFKPSNAGIICGAAGGIGSSTTFAMYTRNGSTSDLKDFEIRLRGTSSNNTIKSDISVNSFHMGAFTWDGTSALGYYNNEPPVTVGVGTAGNQNYRYGIADPTNGSLGNYSRFQGSVTYNYIYDRALTAREIRSIYESTKGGFE